MLFLFMRYQNEVNEKPSPSVDYQLSSHCQCFKIEVSGLNLILQELSFLARLQREKIEDRKSRQTYSRNRERYLVW